MSAADAAGGGRIAGALKSIGGSLGLGGGAAGAADALEGNGLDHFDRAIGRVARSGGDVLGAVNDLVNVVTPDFLSDLIPSGAGGAADAAGVLVPHAADAMAALGVVV